VHAQKAEADRAVADAQQELKSLQKQLAAVQSEGEVRVTAALASARQQTQDQAQLVRQLEAELRDAKASLEAASQVHAQKAEADRAVADQQQELKSLQKQLAAVQSEGEVRVTAALCKRSAANAGPGATCPAA